MTLPPALSRQDVVEHLERLYRTSPARERHLVAFFGTGQEEAANTSNAGQFRIVPVRSELELREHLPPIERDDERVAFLVPWVTDIPLDISGRFARNGRVFRIGTDARLRTLFGASEIEDGVRGSKLAAFLLATMTPGALRLPAGRVTLAAVFSEWMASWGVPRDELSLDTLLAWASSDAKGAAFASAMQAPLAEGVRDELLDHLRVRLGDAGPVVWRAWEAGRGRVVLSYALLFQTLASSAHAGVKMWIKIAPRAAMGVAQEADMPVLAVALGAAADGAIRRIERESAKEARLLAKDADALVEDADVREALRVDRRLPSAWRARLDTIGQALTKAATNPTVDAVTAAVEALRTLDAHVFFSDGEQTPVVKRAEMAVRLAAWLCARPDQKLEGPPTTYADVEILARWYADEGGYVDWARRFARGTATDAFGKGAEAVVEAADQAREALDRRFAGALPQWIAAQRPSKKVVPIDDAVRRIAVKFLSDNPARQLLVVLLDGMAWAQAVELLHSLGQRIIPWGPLAWHATSATKIGDGVNPAILASLPTVTEISRAAFFGGKVIGPGAATKTEKDVDRWAENADVAKLVPPNEKPRLLLRGEGHTQSGVASPEALSLVGDRSRRIVAIVINAIDASLKGDPQARHTWKVENIQSLADLLEKAREAERAVLLASDHGHVPADRLVSRGTPDGAGARWRPWRDSDGPVAPHEVVVKGPLVGAPKGADGVVLLADDGSRYGGAAHAGEHGGASLAEVVAPCLLIGCEDVALGKDDAGLAVRAAHVPLWWHYDLKAVVPIAEAVVPSPTGKPPKRRISSSQLALPTMALPKPSAFASSAILVSLGKTANELREIVAAVEFLLERNGVASDESLAAALETPVWRVGGLVSKLGEALNVDGFPVIRHDPASKTVRLDRQLLAQQFEITL